MIKVYPTKFEAYDMDMQIFRVEAFDESAANVYIDTVVDVAIWDEIAPLIRKCLVDMEISDDK